MTMAIVLTVTTLGASTYAWFSLNTTNTVEQINMTVVSGVGIYATLDTEGGVVGETIDYSKKDWLNEITSSEINDTIGRNIKLVGTTTTNGKVFTKNLDPVESAVKNQDYIELTIYFKVVSQELDNLGDGGVYLVNYNNSASYSNNANGTYVVSEGKNFKPSINYLEDSENNGTEGIRYASNAVYASFDSDGFANPLFVNFDKNPLRGYGYPYGAIDYYNKKSNNTITAPATPSAFTNAVYATTNSTYTKGFTTFTAENGVQFATNNNTLVSQLTYSNQDKCYYGYTVMRLWVEGWDGDCFDAIYSDKIKAQLNFEFAIIKNNN
jgi:hypothetical protein